MARLGRKPSGSAPATSWPTWQGQLRGRACWTSLLDELDDAKASFVVAEAVGLDPRMHRSWNQPHHAMWGAA